MHQISVMSLKQFPKIDLLCMYLFLYVLATKIKYIVECEQKFAKNFTFQKIILC